MTQLIEYVGHPDLCAQIVGQFAFMKAMARPEDNGFQALQTLSLDDIFHKADDFFVQFTSIEELIDTEECQLAEKITSFLAEWEQVTDVTAIQQNIHFNLKVLDDTIDLKN